ncbi:MAG: ATP-binding protein [Planctomycetes bacterium]|nr:ATP-binding protein [Planctomycetota bacterium]MCK5579341.1 ATP-binding protein [Planctomycetota bacterium]
MEDLSLHILDIVENSIAASAKRIEIKIEEDQARDLLVIEIKDDGQGMDEQMLKKARDPFFTTRKTRNVGLGLSLLTQAARESEGLVKITSAPNKGTTVKASFRHSHPDRKPMGDIDETIKTIIVGHPEVDLLYEYKKNNSVYRFDTKDIKSNGG